MVREQKQDPNLGGGFRQIKVKAWGLWQVVSSQKQGFDKEYQKLGKIIF